MRRYVSYIVFVAVIAGIVVCVGKIRQNPRMISTVGQCITKVSKDKFAITLQIKTLDKNAAVSMQLAQYAADEVVQAIKRIPDKTLEIQTKNINSYEKTKWEKESSILLGIESEISLEITSSDKATINGVLAAASVRNAQVFPQGMRNFSSQETITDAVGECLQIAILDARDKATTLANADGEELGRMISVQLGSIQGSTDNPIMFERAMMAKGSSGDYIQSSDGELAVTVSATFGIK